MEMAIYQRIMLILEDKQVSVNALSKLVDMSQTTLRKKNYRRKLIEQFCYCNLPAKTNRLNFVTLVVKIAMLYKNLANNVCRQSTLTLQLSIKGSLRHID